MDDWESLFEELIRSSKTMETFISHMIRGIGILRVMHALFRFRAFYGGLQDTPLVLNPQAQVTSNEAWLNYLLARAVILGFWTMLVVHALL